MSGIERCLAPRHLLASSGEPGLVRALVTLAKPGIVCAEVLTGLVGMLLAASGKPLPTTGWLLLVAIAAAAAGAAMLNGILDAAADRLMPRLARRCHALERVGPRRLLVIGLALMAAGVMLTALSAPPLAVVLLVSGCLSYLWLYTAWLKRCSPWGVLAGGIPGALPPLIGAAAIAPPLTVSPLLLALTVFIWQLPHFWLLALHCRSQYAQAGIPVLPLIHGEAVTKVLTMASVLLLLPVTLVLGRVGGASPAGLTVIVVAGGAYACYCCRCLYLSCHYRRGFIASLGYLLIILATVAADPVLIRLGGNLW